MSLFYDAARDYLRDVADNAGADLDAQDTQDWLDENANRLTGRLSEAVEAFMMDADLPPGCDLDS